MEEAENPMQQQQPVVVPGVADFNLAIASAFTMNVEDFVIKQEPQEIIPELMSPEVMDQDVGDNAMFDHREEEAVLGLAGDTMLMTEEEDDEGHHLTEEYPDENDDLMQRAVSPPSCDDFDDQRIEELRLYYKDIYNLKDVSVKLENIDKVWETLKIIKLIQPLPVPVEESLPTPPLNFVPTIPLVSPPPKIVKTGYTKKICPDYRFSVKSHRKIYHCLTCKIGFTSKELLTEHAYGVHKFYTVPKRMYKMREDQIQKIQKQEAKLKSPVTPHIHENHFSERPKVMNVIPGNLPINLPVIENVQPVQAQNVTKPVETVRQVKKFKCILCKRIMPDIVGHLKHFHKVGCFRPIAAQCEVIMENAVPVGADSSCNVEDNPVQNNGPLVITNEIAAEDVSNVVENQSEMNINYALSVTTHKENRQEPNVNTESTVKRMKKKRRNATNWTMAKKRKVESGQIMIRNSNSAHVIMGPFTCDICQGQYKTLKTFRHHKKLHMMRKETPENFDPSKCRFLNSPLKASKSSLSSAAVNKSPKLQTPITNYVNVVNKSVPLTEKNNEPIAASNQNVDADDENELDQTTCGICGRTFRDYHAKYLHTQKCKAVFSIKIKKNKDSYEVVPSNISQDESYKEPRSSKDSDVSSNDSGLASVSSISNNKKSDLTDPVTKNTHSILRIQVAEDDEEVDIEDEESIDSMINGDISALYPETDSESTQQVSNSGKNKIPEQIYYRNDRYSNRRSNVPSLSNLCKQLLEKMKESEIQMSTYKCQSCSKFFNDKTELMKHGIQTQHNVKTICSCGREFKNLKYLNIHIRRFHPDSTRCGYCKTKFDRIEKYIEHECELTEEKIYIEPILQTHCLQCKTLLDIEEPFDKHMRTHSVHGAVFYQCFKCDLRFDNIDMRKAHFNKEHGLALCRVCSKRLNLDHLSSHEAYHDGLGYPCHTCKKTFTQKNLLKKHNQFIHDPAVNDVIKCLVCSKSMKLKHLRKHMREHLHSEICKKCNKCYRNDDQRDVELQVAVEHSKVNPILKCDTCSLTFTNDKDLQEHVETGSCKVNEIDAPIILPNVKIEPVTD